MQKKIVFMGTPEFSVPILKSIYENNFSIEAVYTQPPQKSQRGQKLNKSPINQLADSLGINCRTPASLKKNYEELEFIKKINPDIVIVVAYGQIIPKEFLEICKLGFINIHGSILPKWRGAAPIQRAIMNLDRETGISIMKIKEKLDSGPVCAVYKIALNSSDNAIEVSKKLSLLAAEKIIIEINNILNEKAKFVEQNHELVTYAAKIDKSEGLINWKEDAKKIFGKVNGLFPIPGAFFIYKNERYKILKAEIDKNQGNAGEVLTHDLEVACGDNHSLKILEIQRQGKKPQKIEEFILGSQIKKGASLLNV
jgi:methionyl-tRNA formyltransferase